MAGKKGSTSTGGLSVHSAAVGMTELPSVGGGSIPASPSIHPIIDLTGKSGDTAIGSSPTEAFCGMSQTVSKGGVLGVNLADVAETPAGNLGGTPMGLGDSPKPSGSY